MFSSFFLGRNKSLANKNDLNRRPTQILAMLAERTQAELAIFALMLLRFGTCVLGALRRDMNDESIWTAVIILDLMIMLSMMLISGKKNIVGAILSGLAGLLLSGAFCFGLYVNGCIGNYLTTVQMRTTVIILQVVMILFLIMAAMAVAALTAWRVITIRSNYRIKTGKELIFKAAVLLGIAICSAGIYYVVSDLDSVSTSQRLYQVKRGEFINYNGSSKIRKAGNLCNIENAGKTTELLEQPLYYDDGSEILLPAVYAVIQPSINSNRRVDNLSRIVFENGDYLVRNESGSTVVSDFFLYDGRNTYIFFENTSVEIGTSEYEITPFSTVTGIYNKQIEIYDAASGRYTNIPIGKESANVRLSDGTVVNVSMDLIARVDGQEQMLFVQPAILEVLG